MSTETNEQSQRPPEEMITKVIEWWKERARLQGYDYTHRRKEYLEAQANFLSGAGTALNWVDPIWWIAITRGEDVIKLYEVRKTKEEKG